MLEQVNRARQGDRDAFAALMERCQPDLYRVARGYFSSPADIADAIQETILACWEHLPELRQPRYFKTWLIRILINKCTDLQRAGRRWVPLDQLPPEAERDDAGEARAFAELLELLDEIYRPVFLLYYGEGYKVREIGAILGLTGEAVKSRLRRGRTQLRARYEALEGSVCG